MGKESRLRVVVGGLASLLLIPALSGSACAQQVDESLWVTDGVVLAIARSESTLYMGGNFRAVGPCTGGGVPLDRDKGMPVAGFPKVAGVVLAAVPDGEGGWYLGGEFVGVGGEPRVNLAHVRSDCQVDDWSPNPDGPVQTMVTSGDRLYVGGGFSHIAGGGRSCAAAFRLHGGALTPWDPECAGYVHALLPRAHEVFVGGDFLMVGGASRTHLAAVDAERGRPSAWNPQPNSTVRALALRGDVLYVGGSFEVIGGVLRSLLAAVDLRSGAVTPWNPRVLGSGVEYDAPPYVGAITLADKSVFVAGHFESIAGQERGGVAELDLVDGRPTVWSPSPVYEGSQAPYIWAVVRRGRSVYVGGRFSTFGGAQRLNLAAVDADSGRAQPWDPGATGDVHVIVPYGRQVFVGGEFGGAGNVQLRRGIAALDARTGAVTPWNPGMWGFTVQALAVSGPTVYAGGVFFRMGDEWRTNLAAVDARTGRVSDWDPEPAGGYNAGINALAVKGGTIYVGGGFTSIGGASRPYLAAIDSATGRPIPWSPGADDIVNCLLIQDSTLFVGGSSLAAVDLHSARVTYLDHQTSGTWITALAADATVLYVGGDFDALGGQPRHSLAALDRQTGLAIPWNPDPGGMSSSALIQALALTDHTLYAGGTFRSVAEEPRSYVAGIDAISGAVTPWDAGTDGWVWAMTEYRGTIYVGGLFSRMGLIPRGNLAALCAAAASQEISRTAGTSQAPTLPTETLSITPNPLHSDAVVHFSLSSAAPVRLTIYDLQGRRLSTLLDGEIRLAGDHVVPCHLTSLSAGYYLCRLEVGGRALVRKLVVVR